MAENKTLEHLPEVRAAVAALSPEDREVLAAVQTSPFKLTAPEQFKEFAANIDYFVFEPNIHDLNDLGWRYVKDGEIEREYTPAEFDSLSDGTRKEMGLRPFSLSKLKPANRQRPDCTARNP